ncbi:MAG: nicotinate (nicotinamide) nucleotide adenylyltransferase [Sarcina sp.]
MNKRLIAIYGGSFNPPTMAHKNIVKDILSIDLIKEVIYLPVGDKYTKKNLINSKYRVDMLNILKSDLQSEGYCVNINTLEVDTEKRLYTLESLRILKKIYKNDLAFVMGTDNIKEFETWYDCQNLLEEFYFIIIERQNDDVNKIIKENNLLSNYQNRFIILKETSYKNVSSTYIRDNLYIDLNITKYISPKIIEYIKNNNLYKGGN